MADATKNVFDELFVISDLHLGGEDDPTLFAAGDQFKTWMQKEVLPRCGPDRHVGLVINGDMFDFLAERGATYFDPLAARGAVSRIAADPQFKPVFVQLRVFLKSPNTRLAITLGNHDLELCDTGVQEAVATALAQPSQVSANAKPERIIWALKADGYRCRVGRKRVQCCHGNEADPYNKVDLEELKRELQRFHRNPTAPAWIPNAGTQMVVDVVNPVRKKWPFAQILKPEDCRLALILLCVDPSQRQRLRAFTKAIATLPGGLIRTMTHWLLAPPRKGRRRASRVDRQLLVAELVLATNSGVLGANPLDTAAMLRVAHEEVEETWRRQERLRGLGTTAAEKNELRSLSERRNRRRQRLDWRDAAVSLFRGADRIEILRQYLKRTTPEPKFDPLDQTDEVYQHFRQKLLKETDFLVTGHTHHCRAGLPLPLALGGARYYNTGTWARILRIPQEVISESHRFIDLFSLLQQEQNKRLFEDSQFVDSPCDYLHLRSDGDQVIAELKKVS